MNASPQRARSLVGRGRSAVVSFSPTMSSASCSRATVSSAIATPDRDGTS